MAKKLKRKKSKGQSAQQAPQLDLKIVKETLDTLLVGMAIEVNSSRVDYELRQAARKVSKDYKFPGFREGRAPYSVIAERLGTDVLYNEFVERLFDEVYPVALAQEELEAYGNMVFDRLDQEPLTYHIKVPLEPVVDICDYHALAVDEIITEEDMSDQLNAHRQRLASWTRVERSSISGDTVNIDVKSLMLDADGNVTDETFIEEDDLDVLLDPDKESEFSGLKLDQALVGVSADDEMEVVLGWPEDGQSVYAGQQAQFSIKVNAVEEFDVPELNDELAQMLDPDCESLEALRAVITKALLDHAAEDPNDIYLNKALDRIIEGSKLEYPVTSVEEQINTIVQNQEAQIRQQFGIGTLEQYLEASGQTLEQFREQFRPQADLTVRRHLVLFEVALAEELEIPAEDLEARIQELLANTPAAELEEAQKNVRSEHMIAIISNQLLREAAGDIIFEAIYGEALDAAAEDEEDEDDDEADVSDDTGDDASTDEL